MSKQRLQVIFHKPSRPDVNYARLRVQLYVYNKLNEMDEYEVEHVRPESLDIYDEKFKTSSVSINSVQVMTIVNPDNGKAIIFNVGPKVEQCFSPNHGYDGFDVVQVIGGSSLSEDMYRYTSDEIRNRIDTIRKPLTFPMDQITEQEIAKNYPIDRESPKIRKCIFIGNTTHPTLIGRQKIGDILNKHPLFEITHSMRGSEGYGFQDYLDEMNKYKLSISLNGYAEMCYRDWESMALAMPIVRSEVYSKYSPELISGHHYISATEAPRNGMIGYHSSFQDIADQFIAKVEEVIDNDELLNEVGKNGRKYFEDNILAERITENFFERVNLELLR